MCLCGLCERYEPENVARSMKELNDEDDAWTARDVPNRRRHKGINKEEKNRKENWKHFVGDSFFFNLLSMLELLAMRQ